MSKLAKLLNRRMWQQIAEEGQQRELAKAIFTEWRDLYVSALCAYIRLYYDAARHQVQLPEPYMDIAYCNAAVDLLTHAPEDVQDVFMRATEDDKDKMIQAVIDDGGILDLTGHFHDLHQLP